MLSEHVNEANLQGKLRGIRSDLLKKIETDEAEAEAATKRVQKNRELLQALNKSLGLLTAQDTGFRKLSHTIRSVIESLEKDRFTAPDIEHALTAQFPTVPIDKAGVRSTLWNMTKRTEIVCTRKGNNREPAEYSRVTTGGGTASADGRGIRRRIRPSVLVNGEHSK